MAKMGQEQIWSSRRVSAVAAQRVKWSPGNESEREQEDTALGLLQLQLLPQLPYKSINTQEEDREDCRH